MMWCFKENVGIFFLPYFGILINSNNFRGLKKQQRTQFSSISFKNIWGFSSIFSLKFKYSEYLCETSYISLVIHQFVLSKVKFVKVKCRFYDIIVITRCPNEETVTNNNLFDVC